MKTVLSMALVLAVAMMASAVKGAAPAAKAATVVAGYPAWTGLTDKNYLRGRKICPSDLRQKTTVVVVVEASKLRDQIDKTGNLCSFLAPWYDSNGSESWERKVMMRDVIVVYSVIGGIDHAKFTEAIKFTDVAVTPGIGGFVTTDCPTYQNLTFPGAPDAEGKYPFVYIMGDSGTTPLYQGACVGSGCETVRKCMADQVAAREKAGVVWRPYYGYVAEPKHVKSLSKLIKAGKPLAPALAEAQKGISSKDEEVAKECQIIYDALEQTRSDLAFRISTEVVACPHRAAYDLSVLLKYWPGERKRVEDAAAIIKANGEAQPLVRIFPKILQWSDPAFTCKASERKKILAELAKAKRQMEQLRASKNMAVQNGALVLDAEIDTLMSTFSSDDGKGG